MQTRLLDVWRHYRVIVVKKWSNLVFTGTIVHMKLLPDGSE